MSAPAPASRRSGSGSRRFNPLRVLQPKRRLQQILASSAVPVPKPASGTAAPVATAPVAIPVPAPPAFDYCRFIELDYVPMETGYMVSMRPTKGYTSSKSPTKGFTSTKSPERHSHATNSPSTPRSRSVLEPASTVAQKGKRTPAAPSTRDPYGNVSHNSSSNSGSCKGSDCSPTKGRPKFKSCTDNHGIRPPPPEQYLTPLQQKEVCIRHLRAKLKETIDTLQNRDTEIDELRERLYRMQEDWVEEECHRVEAQLALKEARQEIQQLKYAVDTVRTRLSDAGGLTGDAGVQKYFQDINTQNHKLENLLLSMEIAQAGLAKEGEGMAGFRTRVGGSAPASVSGESPGGGLPKPVVGGRVGSCSCDGSPARSLPRSSTYTKLSEQALADRISNGPDFGSLSAEGTQDSGFVCCGESTVPSRADLLLEAAYLSEETASLLSAYTQTFSSLPNSVPNSLPHAYSQTLPHSFPRNLSHPAHLTMPHSSTYEKLCTGDHLAPFRCGLSTMSCMSHPCLSHHHLYLHPLREAGIQTESCPIPATGGYPSDLDTIAEARTFRSQACSPTSTWMSDDGEEELDSITTTTSLTTATVMTTATEPIPMSKITLGPSLPRSATVACSMESPLCNGDEEEEKQEREKREKEASLLEKSQEQPLAEQPSEASVEEVQPEEKRPTEESKTASPEKEEIALNNVAEKQGELDLEVGARQGTQDQTIPIIVCGEIRQEDIDLTSCTTELEAEELSPSYPPISPDIEKPQTSQPKRSTSNDEIANAAVAQEIDGDEEVTEEQGATGGAAEDEAEDSGAVQKSYWSRHFLVDLLAVAIPVVPTVAWLCRGPVRDGQPMYHIGSLLRGCCTVALHSLRRGGGLRHYPAGGGDLGGSHI